MLYSIHQRRVQDDVPSCPSCHHPVPTSSDAASAYTFNIRQGGTQSVCLKRDCYCGQELSIEKCGDFWCYSFRCQGCKRYAADLFPRQLCTHCELETVVGVKDAGTLVEGLHESDVEISASRNDLLEGLLKGLLCGAPGLTTDEAA